MAMRKQHYLLSGKRVNRSPQKRLSALGFSTRLLAARRRSSATTTDSFANTTGIVLPATPSTGCSRLRSPSFPHLVPDFLKDCNMPLFILELLSRIPLEHFKIEERHIAI